jgi:hypothetical protein
MSQQGGARRIVAAERPQLIPLTALAPDDRRERQHLIADRPEALPARSMLASRRDRGAMAIDGEDAADRQVPGRRVGGKSEAGGLEEREHVLHRCAGLCDDRGRTGAGQAHSCQVTGRVDEQHARRARRRSRERERGPGMRATERPDPVAVLPCPVDDGDDLVRRPRRACPDPLDLDRLRPILEPPTRDRDPAGEAGRRLSDLCGGRSRRP